MTAPRLGAQQQSKVAITTPSAVLRKATYLFETHRQPASMVGDDQEVVMEANLVNQPLKRPVGSREAKLLTRNPQVT